MKNIPLALKGYVKTLFSPKVLELCWKDYSGYVDFTGKSTTITPQRLDLGW